MITLLAWFAMLGSIIKAVTFPLVENIENTKYEEQHKFMVKWLRTALEAFIITLLALRVLGKI